MTGYFSDAGSYLVGVVFGFYILAVLLRFLFQMVRADFYNPLSQAVVKITNPPLRLLRRYIPGYRGVDVPALLLMLALKMLELWLTLAMAGHAAALPGLVLLALAELAKLVLYVFMIAILIEVVLSWVSPGAYNPLTQLLYSLTRPLLAPARRLIPPLAGLDLSPLAVVVALQIALLLLIAPLRDFSYTLL